MQRKITSYQVQSNSKKRLHLVDGYVILSPLQKGVEEKSKASENDRSLFMSDIYSLLCAFCLTCSSIYALVLNALVPLPSLLPAGTDTTQHPQLTFE